MAIPQNSGPNSTVESRRKALPIVYLTVFIDLLGFSIILPSLPYYAQNLGANGALIGVLIASYSITQFVGAAVFGRLSDRLGRRPILLLSLLGSTLSLLLSGFATSLWLLLVGRALAGLFGGSIATAQAYVADGTLPEERAKYMGLLGASIGMGFVFGPAIGAGLAGLGFGFGASAFFASALAALNLIAAYFRLPESRPKDAIVSPKARFSVDNLVDTLTHPAVGRVLGATFLSTFAFVGMETVAALFGEARFGMNAGTMGLAFFYMGIVTVIIQGGAIGPLTRRFGEKNLAITGSSIMGASLLAIAFSPTILLVALFAGTLAAGQGLTTPSLSTLLSRQVDADEQGGTLGIGQSLSAISRAIGPLVAGWLYDQGQELPFILGALLVSVGAWVLYRAVALQYVSTQSHEVAGAK